MSKKETITLPAEGTVENQTAHPSIVIIDDAISQATKTLQQVEAQEKQLKEEFSRIENALRNNQVHKIVVTEQIKMLQELKSKIVSVI